MDDDEPLRELLILRHAKSAWDRGASSDFDRPLAARGERDAPRIGAWISENELVPDLVVSSPARRAEQTTTFVVDQFDIDPETVRWDDRLYGAGGVELLEVLNEEVAADPARVLLVGHNPGLEELVAYLSGAEIPQARDEKAFPTAALAILRLPDGWSSIGDGAGELVDVIRPRRLR